MQRQSTTKSQKSLVNIFSHITHILKGGRIKLKRSLFYKNMNSPLTVFFRALEKTIVHWEQWQRKLHSDWMQSFEGLTATCFFSKTDYEKKKKKFCKHQPFPWRSFPYIKVSISSRETSPKNQWGTINCDIWLTKPPSSGELEGNQEVYTAML